MEFLSAVIVAAALSIPVVGPTGIELERLVDETDPFPGNGSPVSFDGPPPVPCGEGVALRALADSPMSWIYYATTYGVEVVADEETIIPGTATTFDEVGEFSCLGGSRVMFLGGRSAAPASPFSAYQWRPGIGVELIQSGGVTIDGIDFGAFVDGDGSLSGLGLEGRRNPMSLGNALVLKPFNSAPLFVADENVILPGRADPVTAYTSPGVFGEDLVFRALVVLSRGLYRWSPSAGFSVIADDATPVPGGMGTFDSITRYTVLSTGLAFSGVYSGGVGIFHYDDNGTIEPLVLPGDQTVSGETLLSAFTPRGEGTLFSFRGSTVETAPFESVFARTADGLIYRVLGERDEIEGKTVLRVDGEADRDTVAVRIATLEDFEEIVYTAEFGDSLSDIPTLSPAALAILASLLAVASLVLLRRVAPK